MVTNSAETTLLSFLQSIAVPLEISVVAEPRTAWSPPSYTVRGALPQVRSFLSEAGYMFSGRLEEQDVALHDGDIAITFRLVGTLSQLVEQIPADARQR